MVNLKTSHDIMNDIKISFSSSPLISKKCTQSLINLIKYVGDSKNEKLNDEYIKTVFLFLLRAVSSEDLYIKIFTYCTIDILNNTYGISDAFLATSALIRQIETYQKSSEINVQIYKGRSLLLLFSLTPDNMYNEFINYLKVFLINSEEFKYALLSAYEVYYRYERENKQFFNEFIGMLGHYKPDSDDFINSISLSVFYLLYSKMDVDMKTRVDLYNSLLEKKYDKISGLAQCKIIGQLYSFLYKESRSNNMEVINHNDIFKKTIFKVKKCLECTYEDSMISLEMLKILMNIPLNNLYNFKEAVRNAVAYFLNMYSTVDTLEGISLLSAIMRIVRKIVEFDSEFFTGGKKLNLERLINHKNRAVRSYVVEILLKISDIETVDRLIGQINTTSFEYDENFKFLILTVLWKISNQYEEKFENYFLFLKKILYEKSSYEFKNKVITFVSESLRLEEYQALNFYTYQVEPISITSRFKLIELLTAYIEDCTFDNIVCNIITTLQFNVVLLDQQRYRYFISQFTNMLLNQFLMENNENIKMAILQCLYFILHKNQDSDFSRIVETLALPNTVYEDYCRFLMGTKKIILPEKIIEETKEVVSKEEIKDSQFIKETCQQFLSEDKEIAIFYTKEIWKDKVLLKISIRNDFKNLIIKNGILKLQSTDQKINFTREISQVNINETIKFEVECKAEHMIINGAFKSILTDEEFEEDEEFMFNLLPIQITLLDFIRPVETVGDDLIAEKNSSFILNLNSITSAKLKVKNIFNLHEEADTGDSLILKGVYFDKKPVFLLINCQFNQQKKNIICIMNFRSTSENLLERIIKTVEK